MKRWSGRKWVTLMFGVCLALGLSLSAVQAGDMAVEMAMGSDTGDYGPGSCDGCGSGDDAVNALTCPSALSCSGVAVLAAQRDLPVITPVKLSIPASDAARGLAAPPEPDPPRSLELG